MRHYILLVGFSFFALSCSPVQKEIRAYTDQNPDWKMVENCGYERCYPMVDFLTGQDIALEVIFDENKKQQFFIIRTTFTSVNIQFQFNTSNVVVTTENRERLKPKGFTCSYTIANLRYLRSKPFLQGEIPVKPGDCYLLFFDHPAPPKDEELTMDMNEALTANGKPIGMPLIRFRKNPKAD